MVESARSVQNAHGRDIHPSHQGVQAFWNWFDGSKTVDQRGRPIVLYHGTKSDFQHYDIKRFGASDEGLAGPGFYFTYNPEEASRYALVDFFGRGEAPNVQPVYVCLKNPFFIAGGLLPDGRKVSDLHEGSTITVKGGVALRRLADIGGHDGIIWLRHDGGIGHAIAFKPEQIKSALGNDGTFSPDDPTLIGRLHPACPSLLASFGRQGAIAAAALPLQPKQSVASRRGLR